MGTVNPIKAIVGQRQIDTRTWNGLVDMLEWWRARYAFGNTGGSVQDVIFGNRITVYNNSSTNLLRGDVMALDRVAVLTSLTRREPWIKADELSASSRRRNEILVCLIDPLKASNFGPAQLNGVCLVRVDVKSTWHRRAYPIAGDNVLDSGVFGPVELLNTPTLTGVQECLATINVTSNPAFIAKTKDEIAVASLSGSSLELGGGTCYLYEPAENTDRTWEPGMATAYDEKEFEAYNMTGNPIDEDHFVLVHPGEDWVPIITLEPCTQPEA